jgi:DNA invertase Pin-like site-specific DNA recombinase
MVDRIKNDPNGVKVARSVGGVSYMTVHRIAQAEGIKLTKGRPKLEPEVQQQILKLVKKGKTAAEAARLFGVHPATVGRLLQRT